MPAFDFAVFIPLIAFALWAVAMQFTLAFARSRSMARSKRGVETFKPIGDEEGLDAISRAHMNTVENLPVFTVTLAAAVLSGAAAPIGAIAWTALGARVVQSLTHIASRTANAVRLRAVMMLVQALCFLWLGGAALLALAER